MSLRLYFHPLSSFCQKVLIALYENETPFTPQLVDFGDAAAHREFLEMWPPRKIPVLRDEAHDRMVPETSIIIEYLQLHYPGKVRLIPDDPDIARQVRFRDRFYDLYVNAPMQKIVTDRLRPAGKNDPFGVDEARTLLRRAIGMIDREMGRKTWSMGDAFTMADCAAAPALFYADWTHRIAETCPRLRAYRARLLARASFARAVEEARPYRSLFPLGAPDRD